MTDTDRLYRVLREAGPRGQHTFDLRRMGFGNPSQRANEIEDKYGVKVDRPTERRNGRNGARFTLNVGSTTKGSTRPHTEGSVESGSLSGKTPGVASGVATSPLLPVPVEAHARTIPSAYSDVWVNEAA